MKELLSLKRALHGTGPVLFHWDPNGTYLATVGCNRRLHVFDRGGQLVDEQPLPQPRPALQLEWSCDGEHLAVIQEGSSALCLWNAHSRRLKQVEMAGVREPSFLCWSRTGGQLAVGGVKGGLLIYNAQTLKSLTVAGKHSKRITCGGWSLDSRLALGSLDRTLTLSDDKGELLEQTKLKHDPADLCFSMQKLDDSQPAQTESTVSLSMGRQTVLLHNLSDGEHPVELAFQSKYGEIVRYHWFGDGYLMIGFSRGFLIAISTHMREIGEELQSLRMFDSALTGLCYSPSLSRLAVSGDDGVKLVDMADWKEMKAEQVRYNQDEGDVAGMEWTADGQILTVSTTGGYVFSYLTSIPQLSAACGSRLLFLSSLRSVSLFDAAVDPNAGDGSQSFLSWDVAIEPTFLALSSSHLAAGMNNHCWFYTLDGAHSLVQEKQYMASVRQIRLNSRFAAVLCDGKLLLHSILPTALLQQQLPDTDPALLEDRVFPAQDDPSVIVDVALTADYLIYLTDRGCLVHWYIEAAAAVNEHKHDCRLLSFFSNPSGTRLVLVDENHRGLLYSPVDDQLVDVSSFPASADCVLFDPADSNTFVAVDARTGKQAVTFVYAPQSCRGPTVTKLTNSRLPFSFLPILLYDGQLHGQKAGGGLSSLLLSSHDALSVAVKGAKRTPERLRQGLTQLLALNRLSAAWELALVVKQKEQMLLLARKACDQLDVELAVRVYREMKDTAMVLALLPLLGVEDKQLLAGHVCLLSGDYNRAASLFLSSSQPQAALEMRRDLLQWEQALKLAVTVQPDAIPAIAREYAAQLEVKGEYAKALELYSRCTLECSSASHERERLLARNGIARMTLRLGDLQRGLSLAYASEDSGLLKECAAILESLRQLSDAADMYSRAQQYEKAVQLYNGLRQYAKAAPLLQLITTPRLHAQYAAAKEKDGEYSDALLAYEKARDVDSMIRILLQHTDQIERAFAIGRQSQSPVGAEMIAKYCIQHSDFAAAVEFLFIAKRHEEAFTMAKQQKSMDIYAKVLGEQGTMTEYRQLAEYYEADNKTYAQAAYYYSLLAEYSRSLKLYLSITPQPSTENIHAAIEVVKRAQQSAVGEVLLRQLHDYLIGDSDGVVKDLNYIFRLYLSIGEYSQAAHTATLIAGQEQAAGQYHAAHSILLSIAQELRRRHISIPNELKRQLLLLHSYRLAKLWSQKGNHVIAARMLLRVCKSLSRFPQHTVQILTSTVVECQRAGLKRSAFEYGSVLMRPEHRGSVDVKYRKAIENFIRRPQLDESEETQSRCPFCRMEIPDTDLECVGCRNDIPMCAVTGRHMLSDDWSECPRCKFAVLHSAMIERLQSDGSCVMCGEKVSKDEIVRIQDVQAYLYQQDEQAEKDAAGLPKTALSAAEQSAGKAGSSPAEQQDAVDIEVKF